MVCYGIYLYIREEIALTERQTKQLADQKIIKQKSEGWVTVDRKRYLDAIAR